MSDFKGVWIPAKLWECKTLTIMEKLFLTQIYSLEKAGGCTAGNAYFYEFFDVTKSRCSQILKSLEKKKMIKITIKRDGKLITQRVCKILNLGMYYFTFGYVENYIGYVENYIGYVENAQENNKEKEDIKEDSSLDKRLNLQLPFDIVSTSKTLNATYQKPYLELKEDLKNIFQIDAKDSEIERAIFTFSTIGVASYDKYKSIRHYSKLLDMFKEWIPKSIKFESEKKTTPPEQTQDLETYLLQHYRQKDIDYFKKEGKFEKWEAMLKENTFKVTNIAKGYKNENISPLLIFELLFMPVGEHLSGTTPERKYECFQRVFDKQSDYNKNQGNIRKIIQDWSEKQKH